MDDIRERVRGFLIEFAAPKKEDIQSFIGDIASKNPSLDIDDFRKKLLKVIEQRDELKTCEKELSYLSVDSTAYKELEGILRVAKEGQKNLGDISSVLKKAQTLIASQKGGKEKSENEPDEAQKTGSHGESREILQAGSTGAMELEQDAREVEPKTDISSIENADESHDKPSKKSHKRGKKEKTRKHVEETVKVDKLEETDITGKTGTVKETVEQSAKKEKIPAEAPEVKEESGIKGEIPPPVENAPGKEEVPPQTGVQQVEAGIKESGIAPSSPARETEVPKLQEEAVTDDEISKPQIEKIPEGTSEVPNIQGAAEAKQDVSQPPHEEKTPMQKTEKLEALAESGAKEKISQTVPEGKAYEKETEVPQLGVPKIEAGAKAEATGEEKIPGKVEEILKLQEEADGKKDVSKIPQEGKISTENAKLAEAGKETAAKSDIEKDDASVTKVKEPKKKKRDLKAPVESKGEWLAQMGKGQAPPESAQEFLQRLDMDDTRDILKDQFTPEKQAVFDLLEEKLLSDVETRIKKLKEMQSKVLEDKPPQTLIGKIKTFFTKETEAVEAYDVALHGSLVTFEGMAGFNEIERYWVNEPYAFVVILFDPDNNAYLYYVAEPTLSDFEDLFLKEIKDRLKDVLLVEDIKDEGDKDKILMAKVRQLVKDYAIDITPLTLEKIMYYTRRDFIKFGKIDPLMHDDRIEDISANGHDIPIYLYHKKYTNIPTNIYYNENELNSYVIRLAQRCGKHISIAEPMIDATMPDGSRIQMTLGTEVTSHGATFTIRKFSEIPITPIDLIKWNTFSAEALAYLWLCIENNKSLIYAGGTASGKTSSLNAVSLFIPAQAKIVTLEDTRELKLPHPNWIPGVTRDSFTADGRGGIDMYELLRAALRQRPEFLLVGEVRGKEALTLFQAMSTGHTTFSTMHADSVASAIHRLENPPISVPRTMIQALNIISIQAQTYVGGKRARRNMKLVEITDIDPTTRNIRTNDIFIWDPLTDKFPRVGESKALNEIMVRRGWSPADMRKELTYRQKILEFMVTNKISDFNAISTIIHDYQATPEKVLTKLNITL